MAKATKQFVLVLIKSMAGTGHVRGWVRERTADKVLIKLRDPKLGFPVLYKEFKRIKGMDTRHGTRQY